MDKLLTGIVLSFAVCVLTQPASAQDFASDFQSLILLENEFKEVAKDVGASLQGKISKTSEAYDCLNSFKAAFELSEIFTHYKFSVAIMNGIKDRADREVGIEILKVQTELVQQELQVDRKRINEIVGTCSKFPLVVAKGTEVLTAIKKGEDVVKSIADKL